MGGKRKGPGRKPVIDAAAKVAMLAALREGRRLDEVAASYGVTLQAFYSARRRDPLFAAAWRDAHALSAEAERQLPLHQASPDGCCAAGSGSRHAPGMPTRLHPPPRNELGEDRIVPNNRRALQRRRMRHVRFDERRRGVFLVHFAGSGDAIAAAAAAGVCERTVYNHRRLDPAFAAAFQAALEESMPGLEAEAVRERLEAQQRLRAAIDQAESGGAPFPTGQQAVEFERTMKLLTYWQRKGGRIGRPKVGRPPSMSFDDAMIALEKRLRNLGIPVVVPPPEGDGAG